MIRAGQVLRLAYGSRDLDPFYLAVIGIESDAESDVARVLWLHTDENGSVKLGKLDVGQLEADNFFSLFA